MIMKAKKLILCLILLLCASCTKRIYIPLETIIHRTDTLRQLRERADTLIIRDSVVALQQGDTLRLTHYRDRLKIRTIRDTVYITRADTLRRKTSSALPEVTSRSQSDLRIILFSVIFSALVILLNLVFYKLKK